jgi:ADP-heptose:LPS heptosyltransferase
VLGPDEATWRPALAAEVPGALFPCQDERVPEELRCSPLFTIAVGQRLSAAVANDSGAGHLLAAALCPLVSLFGPTRPEKFAPATPRLEIVRAQGFDGDRMSVIPVAAVIEALERLLGAPATSAPAA